MCVCVCCIDGLVSLFNGRLFNVDYLMPKPFSYTPQLGDKGVHTFPKGICPKVNVIARLEYELTYDSAVHRFNHYTTRRTPPLHWWVSAQVAKDRQNEEMTEKEKVKHMFHKEIPFTLWEYLNLPPSWLQKQGDMKCYFLSWWRNDLLV